MKTRTGAPPQGIKFFDLDNQQTIQDFNNKQLYTKGFSFGLTSGTNNLPCVLGGKARKLYGIILFSSVPTVDENISLTINSEIVIDNVNWKAYNPQMANGNVYKTEQFFPLPRFLSGSDSVQLDWTALGAKNVSIVFYLSSK